MERGAQEDLTRYLNRGDDKTTMGKMSSPETMETLKTISVEMAREMCRKVATEEWKRAKYLTRTS